MNNTSEYIEVTALRDTKRKYLDLKTDKVVVCECPREPPMRPGSFGNQQSADIYLKDCPVHGW